MTEGMELAPRTVRLRRLAAELETARERLGISKEDVAARTGVNATTLWRIETGRAKPQRRTLAALLDLYGITGDRRAELEALAKQALELGWLHGYEAELPEIYGAFIAFEQAAKAAHNYESSFVPGLLQTPEYAAAAISGVLPTADPADNARRAEVRMQRKAALQKPTPLALWAIMDEGAIHREVGGPEVMAEQLRALIDAATKPNIQLQVIPYSIGSHPGMPGSFVVLDFPDPADPDIVYVDSMAGDLFLEKRVEVERYSTIFEHLRAQALSPGESCRLIEQVAAGMEAAKS